MKFKEFYLNADITRKVSINIDSIVAVWGDVDEPNTYTKIDIGGRVFRVYGEYSKIMNMITK